MFWCAYWRTGPPCRDTGFYHLRAGLATRSPAHPTPAADHSVREVLSLPMFAELRVDEVDRVADAVWEFAKGRT